MRAFSRLAVTVVLTTSLSASVAVAQASPGQVQGVAVASAILRLPVGATPTGVPYGIGKTLYLNGKGYNLASSWNSMLGRQPGVRDGVEFSDVDITRGVTVWAIKTMAIDESSRIGWFRPGYAPKAVRWSDSYPGLATTTGGFVAAGLGTVFGGPVPITAYSTGKPSGPAFTWDPEGQPADARNQSVGGRFVFQGYAVESNVDRSALIYPGQPQVALANNTYGVGKGTGWIATASNYGSVCYRTAAVSTPASLRARFCSQTLPMLSDDGTKAVVVQGNHVRVYNTTTGVQLHATNAPTLSTANSSHYYRMVSWQGANSYLVNVRDGNTLAILRCNALTGACTRATTSSVRTGVSAIVS